MSHQACATLGGKPEWQGPCHCQNLSVQNTLLGAARCAHLMLTGLKAGMTPFLTRRQECEPVEADRMLGCPLSPNICAELKVSAHQTLSLDVYIQASQATLWGNLCKAGLQKEGDACNDLIGMWEESEAVHTPLKYPYVILSLSKFLEWMISATRWGSLTETACVSNVSAMSDMFPVFFPK